MRNKVNFKALMFVTLVTNIVCGSDNAITVCQSNNDFSCNLACQILNTNGNYVPNGTCTSEHGCQCSNGEDVNRGLFQKYNMCNPKDACDYFCRRIWIEEGVTCHGKCIKQHHNRHGVKSNNTICMCHFKPINFGDGLLV
ncbi:hypothetical protein [Trichoplusia ni ascovirus 6b]|nr:hypothetical protein [Trichoplusia ni ascovirus 6b]